MRESSVLSGPNYLELSALQKNRRYDIWVKAETSAGYGASSDITSIILGHTGTITLLSLYRTPCDRRPQCPEMILNKIEKTFNKTYKGLMTFLQRFQVCFSQNSSCKVVESTI